MMNYNGYIPTWLPLKEVSVGDYGTFTNNGFSRSGNISQLGIKFKAKIPNSPGEVDYSSSKNVSTNVKLAGQTPPTGVNIVEAKAGVSVKLRGNEEIRFRAIRCKSTEIDDLNAVGQDIVTSYNSGRWQKNHVVVVESISAEGTTVIISNGNKAQVDLSTDVNVGTGAMLIIICRAKSNVVNQGFLNQYW
jgi:hypothetical protein